MMPISRRNFLQQMGAVGALAAGEVLGGSRAHGALRSGPADPPPHHEPRAKRIIYLHMVGGTSQMDLFDPKPELRKRHGEPCPDSMFDKDKLAFIRTRPTIIGSPYSFAQVGQSGAWISEHLPHFKKIVDEVTIIRSLHTDEFNHGPAQLMMLTGYGRFGRPSIGSWVSWGLGSDNRDLPAFVVLTSGETLGAGSAAWGAGFLPSELQGVRFQSIGDPVLFLSNPDDVSRASRRSHLDFISGMNRIHHGRVGDPEIEARVANFELAFRMQESVPDAVDLSKESQETLDLYGVDVDRPSFARNCLYARRLVEKGVRFVQLFDADWDHHSSIYRRLPFKCKDVDQASAALIIDLQRRGLLEDTLVIWSTEFGRTPMAQTNELDGEMASQAGRDHHTEAFSIWLAGGGIQQGLVYGATDDFAYSVTENPVHVHDLNATLLHLLGIDHKRLTYFHQGRDFRLTDVAGEVLQDIIA